MTTRGKYNNIFGYRMGKNRGYIQAKREFYNAAFELNAKHISTMENDIAEWKYLM